MKSAKLKRDDSKIEKHYYKECPVCTSGNIKDKYKLKDQIISECLNCSVLFVKEMLTEDFFKNFYQESKGYFVYEDNNQKFLDYYYHKIKSEIEKIKLAKGAVLDVGCSSGFFLNQMEGWERHGIEISEKYSWF